jgi:hypothetical protein
VNGDKNALNTSELDRICDVLAAVLAPIKKSDAALAKAVQETLRKKIRRKKKANPLLWFVKSVLDSSGVPAVGFPDCSINYQCPFCELAHLPRVTGASRFHMSVGSGAKLIHILSSYSSTHKHKEYSLKVRLAFYRIVARGIRRDPRLQEVGVLLDGRWAATEISVLENAGVKVFAIDDAIRWLNWAKT